MLSKAGACVSSGDSTGQQAIHLAANTGKLQLIDLALDKGAPVDVTNDMGQTALLMAARSGHLPIVEHLALCGASVNVEDKQQQTPLHHAAQANHPPVVQYLCLNGSNLDAIDCWSRTALYLASKHDNHEIVQLLLDAGAQPDIVTEEKLPDLPESPAKGEGAEAEGTSAESETVDQASEPPKTADAQAEAGAEEEAAEEEEDDEEVLEEITARAAIHVACAGLHTDVVSMLAKAGADVDTEADDGLTPLQTAVLSPVDAPDKEERISKIIDTLVEYGATITMTDFNGRTAYQNATVLSLRKVRAKLKQISEVNSSIDAAMRINK